MVDVMVARVRAWSAAEDATVTVAFENGGNDAHRPVPAAGRTALAAPGAALASEEDAAAVFAAADGWHQSPLSCTVSSYSRAENRLAQGCI
jgi:hypothetical protein